MSIASVAVCHTSGPKLANFAGRIALLLNFFGPINYLAPLVSSWLPTAIDLQHSYPMLAVMDEL